MREETKKEIITKSITWFEENCYESPPPELIQDISRCVSLAIDHTIKKLKEAQSNENEKNRNKTTRGCVK